MSYLHPALAAASPERDAHRVFREARAAALGTFSSNARMAITANPDYFVWWYTAKSLALVGALGWVAYLLGKEAGRKERRG